jgi:hypothetical protein
MKKKKRNTGYIIPKGTKKIIWDLYCIVITKFTLDPYCDSCSCDSCYCDLSFFFIVATLIVFLTSNNVVELNVLQKDIQSCWMKASTTKYKVYQCGHYQWYQEWYLKSILLIRLNKIAWFITIINYTILFIFFIFFVLSRSGCDNKSFFLLTW